MRTVPWGCLDVLLQWRPAGPASEEGLDPRSRSSRWRLGSVPPAGKAPQWPDPSQRMRCCRWCLSLGELLLLSELLHPRLLMCGEPLQLRMQAGVDIPACMHAAHSFLTVCACVIVHLVRPQYDCTVQGATLDPERHTFHRKVPSSWSEPGDYEVGSGWWPAVHEGGAMEQVDETS